MTDTDYAVAYKLKRAMKHSMALRTTIRRFLESNANDVINDLASEPDHLIVRGISRRGPPPSCSGLIGEILYNQRASLDFMACELARYNKQVIDEKVEVPIFIDRDMFRNPTTGKLRNGVVKRIGLLRPDHQAVVEDEQPFQGRHGRPEDDPLWLLYRLSNYDRHQFIHLTSVVTNASSHNFTPSEAAARFEQISVTYGAFKSQTEIAKFRILPGDELDVHVQSNVRFDVAFAEDGPGAGRPVLHTLGAIGVRIGEIIQRFTPLV